MIGSFTDEALRLTVEELRKAKRIMKERRERLLRFVLESQSEVDALGNAIAANELVVEQYEAEIASRAGVDIREVVR